MNTPQFTDEQIQLFAQTGMLLENQRLMGEVIRQMKEIPELPSEVPTDVHALTRVELPDEGGVYTYMEGYEYPYKGFPFHEFVDKIDSLKKISRGILSSLFHSLKKRNKLQIVLLALSPWLFNDMLVAAIYAFHRVIIRFKIKELRYSIAVREVYRVIGGSDLKEHIRDILCMVLENDNAYRFRFQDVVPEIDKDALAKNTSKELLRILDLMQEREKKQDVKDTWTLLKTFLPMYLFVNPRVRKEIISIVSAMDMEKIKLDPGDQFFCRPRKDYTFKFMESCQPTTST